MALSEEDKKIIAGEHRLAEKYLCGRIKFKGPIRHIDDGKNDVIISLPWQDVVKLLANYGIARIAESVEPGKHL